MKFLISDVFIHLLVIVTTFEICNAEVKNKHLIKEVKSILHVSEDLTSQIDGLMKLSTEVEAIYPSSSLVIHDFLNNYSQIVQVKEQLKNVKKCGLDERIKTLAIDFEESVNRTIRVQLQAIKLILESMKKKIHKVHDALSKNMDEELKNCETIRSPCRITGEFSATIRDVTEFVKNLDNHIKTLPQSIPSAFVISETPVVTEIIEATIVEPIRECIEQNFSTLQN